jgi:hypothetical protein
MRMLVIGFALVALLGGCGSGSSNTGQSSTSPSVGTADKTPTIEQPGAQPGSLVAVKQRLAAAGYAPQDDEVGGNAVEGLEVDGISVSSYRTTAAAIAEYEAIRAVFRKHAGRGVVRLVGTHLYQFGEPRPLTPTERARFEKIVRIGEAGG